MKLFKFLISSICILLNFSSCITDKKEIPVKTLKPYWIHFEVNATLYEYIDMYLTCLKAEKWYTASTPERYIIEDIYFPKVKLRELGDTIQLLDKYYVVPEFNTIEFTSNTWKVIHNINCDDYYFRVKDSNGKIDITYYNINEEEITFSFKLSYDETLIFQNQGASNKRTNIFLKTLYGNGYLKNIAKNGSIHHVTITEPLEFKYSEEDEFQYFDFISGKMNIIKGYKSEQSPYIINIEYLSSDEMEVNYRECRDIMKHAFSYGFTVSENIRN